jgi:hypothetical protein
MKILAVSDQESSTLLNWIETSHPALKHIDLIVSCGDLSPAYLDFISGALGKEVLVVKGNHDLEQAWKPDQDSFYENLVEVTLFKNKYLGVSDLHGKFHRFKNWIFTGFEGSLWYNGEGPQYHEEEMNRLVMAAEFKLHLRKVLDWFRHGQQQVIVISHAPPLGIHDASDLCHKGFECFHHFMKRHSPVLWIHGHTSTAGLQQNQVSHSGQTTIVNAYEYRFIHLRVGLEPLISYNPSILEENGTLADVSV